MNRVSTNYANDDMQFWLRRTESSLASSENRMSRQQRIENLRDDPLGAAHAVRYDSVAFRLQRWEKNAATLEDAYDAAEGYMRQTIEISQRMRELAVEGATGTLTKDDMKKIGAEVDELLKELVQTANARSSDGTMLFAGTKTSTEPFRIVKGNAPGSDGEAIVGVQYLGSGQVNLAEIGEGATIEAGMAGNQVFQAERQQVVAQRDARGFKLLADASVVVDGREIALMAGDNALTVAARINDSGAAVRASLDPETGGLSLITTDAHQLMMEDGPGSRVLRDLGVLRENAGSAPFNYAPGARVSGGSLFDTAIRLRDALNSGDFQEVGGRGLRGMDDALASMEHHVAVLGSRTERLKFTQDRLGREIPDVTAQLARESDLDISQAVIEMKRLENTHRASLQASGRMLPQTLLDFLR